MRRKKSCLFFEEWPKLQSIGKVQIPYFFDRTADLISQKVGDLRAKCDVIKYKTTDVMFFVMLDYEKAFVGYWILDVDVPQNSNFSPCPSCCLLFLVESRWAASSARHGNT
jgi:alpha-N-acetylglucosamine transferase